MAEYTEQFVNRYMESPAIWGYEFGNEMNLACDLPNAAEHRGGTNTALGQPPTRDANDELTTDIIAPALVQFATIVKANDKYGRIITSGCGDPRPSQYNQRINHSWTKDTEAQMRTAMGWFHPSPMNCVSVHVYDLESRFPGSETYSGLISAYKNAATAAGQTLFIGEFEGENAAKRTQIMDVIVAQKIPLSAVWTMTEHSLTTNTAWQKEALTQIKLANEELKK